MIWLVVHTKVCINTNIKVKTDVIKIIEKLKSFWYSHDYYWMLT